MSPPEFPRIPPMNELLDLGGARGLLQRGREALRRALAAELDRLRAAWRDGRAPAFDEAFWHGVERRLQVVPALFLRGAINATGVVLHTNLGRAPWPPEAVAAAAAVAGAAVLEIDPASGGRGRRERAVSELLVSLTGAGAGLAVNNNAAALLLAVAALARGRSTVLARTEMVEIGGSYRMPEVVRAAGSALIGIGTTNRVHLRDFEEALQNPDVASVLRVHRSNFEQHGFVHEPSTAELAGLCEEYGVPLVYDLGSGVLLGEDLPGASEEPTVAKALADGCAVVTFSGDKLLGGPQAGLIVGVQPLVERIRSDMLTRCLRLDKTLLAALEATLALHGLGEEAARAAIPALQRLAWTEADLRPRADHLVARLQEQVPNCRAEVVATQGRVGSGASPTQDLPGAGVALSHATLSHEELAARLRLADPPLFARIQDEGVVLDLRTVAESEEEPLLAAVIAALAD